MLADEELLDPFSSCEKAFPPSSPSAPASSYSSRSPPPTGGCTSCRCPTARPGASHATCNKVFKRQPALRNHARQPPGLLRMLLHCHRVINEFAFRSHLIAKHGIRGVSKPTQLYGEGRLTAAAGESTGGGPNHANRSSDVRLHTYRPQRQTIHIVTHVTVLVKNKLRVPISSSAVL